MKYGNNYDAQNSNDINSWCILVRKIYFDSSVRDIRTRNYDENKKKWFMKNGGDWVFYFNGERPVGYNICVRKLASKAIIWSVIVIAKGVEQKFQEFKIQYVGVVLEIIFFSDFDKGFFVFKATIWYWNDKRIACRCECGLRHFENANSVSKYIAIHPFFFIIKFLTFSVRDFFFLISLSWFILWYWINIIFFKIQVNIMCEVSNKLLFQGTKLRKKKIFNLFSVV